MSKNNFDEASDGGLPRRTGSAVFERVPGEKNLYRRNGFYYARVNIRRKRTWVSLDETERYRAAKRLKVLTEMLWQDSKCKKLYPVVPIPNGDIIPEKSGIYFLWSGADVVYVGQAQNLKRRLNLNKHHKLDASHTISWLLFGLEDLVFAECYYIGILRPPLNGITPAAVKISMEQAEQRLWDSVE